MILLFWQGHARQAEDNGGRVCDQDPEEIHGAGEGRVGAHADRERRACQVQAPLPDRAAVFLPNAGPPLLRTFGSVDLASVCCPMALRAPCS